MLSRRSLVMLPSLSLTTIRPSPLFFYSFTKFPSTNSHTLRLPLLHPTTTTTQFTRPSPLFFFSSLSATSPIHDSSSSTRLSRKASRKARRESPEGLLKLKLDMCSKHGDVVEALRLYDEALRDGLNLVLLHYNVLLYLCSLDRNRGSHVLNRGFEIFQAMVVNKVVPNEATFTSLARIAAAKEDPEMAFDLIKKMKGFGIVPKLRSYGPALFGFCEKGMAGKAYEVDADMVEAGVVAEEAELSAILKVSGVCNNAHKVYETMHRLRAAVRQVSETTAGVIEDWFKCEEAKKVGLENWDVSKVSEGVVRGGGGWHGQGWLGSGEWRVVRTQMDGTGVCQSCGEKLVCIDIDPKETENFASSLTNVACQREVKADFVRFQEWLQRHGPFDAVVDGANVGLINQHSFKFSQLNMVVKQLRQMSPSKRLPLVILHKNRVTGGPAQHPNNKKLLEHWKNSGALYATPPGSNDDWGLWQRDPLSPLLFILVMGPLSRMLRRM
ncbi:proteinaceous RNase P 1, chloroplastic/mitochondrial-like isoform X3 [Quercus lobata]|uniref:proteinaceous RNase P 1, chloroplastic/mitochondrial-like isoform X3 n=1 Tax=Quercus lobata TaxID=97700 RepID=UPI001243FEC9|nr:proteinaceous RNase P 1, chloroplastic/mitochondrial-like isoform X3 [Quercus lobata]